MDIAQEELNRTIFYVNQKYGNGSGDWTDDDIGPLFYYKTNDEGYTGYVDYYFFDKGDIGPFGDTALHRMLAMHVPPNAVQAFLSHARSHKRQLFLNDLTGGMCNRNHLTSCRIGGRAGGRHKHGVRAEGLGSRRNRLHMSREMEETSAYYNLPRPPNIDDRDKSGATALHVAVQRNSWHAEDIARILIEQHCESIRRVRQELPKEQQRLHRKISILLSYANDSLLKRHALLDNHDDDDNDDYDRDGNNNIPNLASIPMNCGVRPLHLACGQIITVRGEVIDALVEADPNVVLADDINGDTPLTLLWKNALRFRWARHLELGCEEVTEDRNSGEETLPSWRTVLTKEVYWDYSMRLIRAVKKYNKKKRSPSLIQYMSNLNDEEERIRLHDIVSMPRCPPLLVRLALTHAWQEKELITFDEKGMIPLHYALASTKAFTTKYKGAVRSNWWELAQGTPATSGEGWQWLEGTTASRAGEMELTHNRRNSGTDNSSRSNVRLKSVVEILLEAHPGTAAISDKSGRLPLHYALLSGKTCDTVEFHNLVSAYPGAMGIPDQTSGLFPFMLSALDEQERKAMIDDKVIRMSYDVDTYFSYKSDMPTCMPKADRTMPSCQETTTSDGQLDTIYVLLRSCPEVVQYTLTSSKGIR